jgi:hypothetical protein
MPEITVMMLAKMISMIGLRKIVEPQILGLLLPILKRPPRRYYHTIASSLKDRRNIQYVTRYLSLLRILSVMKRQFISLRSHSLVRVAREYLDRKTLETATKRIAQLF